jgi:hypothetical protein
MTQVFDWLGGHEIVLGWLFAISVLMFVGSLIAIPWLVIQIPADYFTHRRSLSDRWRQRHPLLRWTLLVTKNLCGVVLVLAGIAMLVLPGQGILTILVGLVCLDFPGKFALEYKLVRQRPAKAGHPPLELP